MNRASAQHESVFTRHPSKFAVGVPGNRTTDPIREHREVFGIDRITPSEGFVGTGHDEAKSATASPHAVGEYPNEKTSESNSPRRFLWAGSVFRGGVFQSEFLATEHRISSPICSIACCPIRCHLVYPGRRHPETV